MNANLFNQVVTALQCVKDKDGNPLKMDGIIISDQTNTWSHTFTTNTATNDIRSLSKTVLCIALGVAVERGVLIGGMPLTLDSRIWPFFRKRIAVETDQNQRFLELVTVRHLLTHTIGFDSGLMFSKDVADRDPATLLNYIFNTPIIHQPGGHFVYSNAGPYIFSAMIQDQLGVPLDEWVRELLLSKLGIEKCDWKRYGQYCAGSSGLRMTLADVHKFGQLFLSQGTYRGEQIVNKDWLSLMSHPFVLTPSMFDAARAFPKYGYGLGLWVCEDGRFYVDGTDGQYLIVLPKSGLVISTFGHQSDMKPITECLRPLLLL